MPFKELFFHFSTLISQWQYIWLCGFPRPVATHTVFLPTAGAPLVFLRGTRAPIPILETPTVLATICTNLHRKDQRTRTWTFCQIDLKQFFQHNSEHTYFSDSISKPDYIELNLQLKSNHLLQLSATKRYIFNRLPSVFHWLSNGWTRQENCQLMGQCCR